VTGIFFVVGVGNMAGDEALDGNGDAKWSEF
jgi:hypothetical protein